MSRFLSSFLIGLTLSIATPCIAEAGTFSAFGPKTYPRLNSVQGPVLDTFPVLNTRTSYIVRMQFTKGSTADITVNGVLIFSSKEIEEFKKPAVIERPVTLRLSNEIAVNSKGKPGTTVTVEVRGADNDLPTISANLAPSPNAAGWNHSETTVSFVCGDPTSGVSSCSSPVKVSNEGAAQAVTGTAIDRAGNRATTSITVNLDMTPPTLEIQQPAGDTTVHTGHLTAAGIASDGLSGIATVTCQGNPALITGAAFQCPLELVEGVSEITVEAGDLASNTTDSRRAIDFLRLPAVTITAPANLSYLNISPTTVTGTVDDDAATVEVNGIPAAVVSRAFSTAVPLGEGPNVITATARIPSGVTGSSTVQVTLDTTPPHVTITSPSDGFVTTDSLIGVAGIVNDIVVGTVNDEQARVVVNGVPAQVANRAFLVTNVPLDLGSNVIQAVAMDRVGNAATIQIKVTREAMGQETRIRMVSGDSQSGVIHSILPEPLVVALTDAAGDPVPNKPVIFKVIRDNGTLAAGHAPAPTVLATTNAQGRAEVRWTLGDRAGAGANAVEAYAVGFSGTALFSATGTQGSAGKIVVDSGNAQIGVISHPLPRPLIAVVVDGGNNRLAGVPVTFTVLEGGGSFDGQPTFTVRTDSDGRAAATLTLGTLEGDANNRVRADFPADTGFPATFTASGRASGDPAQTTISGVVLDNSNLPIPGVTIRAIQTDALRANASALQAVTAVQTDAQGQFSIAQAPVGFVKLLVDGTTAQLPGRYPTLEYDLVTVPGQNNTAGMPIYLVPLNPNNQLCVTATTGGGTLTLPEAPGFSLTFGPGQATFLGGSKSGCVNVTMVHSDKVPMVPGFGQQPRFIVTIQPAGAVFNPPAPMTLPNVDGLRPRSVTEMYSFDHDIGSFVAIGTGTVSEDGSVIRSDPGVGVLKAGWHCGGDPSAVGHVADCPDCQSCQGTGSCATDDSHTPICGSCSSGTPVFPMTTDQCCDSVAPSQGNAAFVACCNGVLTPCLGNYWGSLTVPGASIIEQCTLEHEQYHITQGDPGSCQYLDGTYDCSSHDPHWKDISKRAQAECDAYKNATIPCLQRESSSCGADADCLEMLECAACVAEYSANNYVTGCLIECSYEKASTCGLPTPP